MMSTSKSCKHRILPLLLTTVQTNSTGLDGRGHFEIDLLLKSRIMNKNIEYEHSVISMDFGYS